jgi:predicted amidohydrolase YtcJ
MTHADLIVVNAHIATLDPNAPEASALAVRDGKVVGVGTVESLHDAFHGPDTRVVDMGGATVMPGLHDAHNHHQIAGKGDLMEIEFLPTASLDQIVEMIRAYALELPEGAWVVGGSWGSTLIAELSEPDAKARIDEAAAGRPVLLVDDSHHNKWANSRALELAGITATTPDPVDGTIVRIAGTNEPSGLLFETAGLIVEKVMKYSIWLQNIVICIKCGGVIFIWFASSS